MYKEVIVRSRVRILISIVLVVVLALYLERFIDILILKSNRVFSFTDIILICITALFILYEIITAKLTYKYSLIANKLIVNKKLFNYEKNLISIKTSDILFVGNRRDIPKNLKSKQLGKYDCNFIQYGDKVCIFRNNDKYYKFNFTPSDKLMNKLIINNK